VEGTTPCDAISFPANARLPPLQPLLPLLQSMTCCLERSGRKSPFEVRQICFSRAPAVANAQQEPHERCDWVRKTQFECATRKSHARGNAAASAVLIMSVTSRRRMARARGKSEEEEVAAVEAGSSRRRRMRRRAAVAGGGCDVRNAQICASSADC
jgi:hypothetical protein